MKEKTKEKKMKKKKRGYQSLKEFKERFYPISSQEELMDIKDPYEFGNVLARKSLKKLRHSLAK